MLPPTLRSSATAHALVTALILILLLRPSAAQFPPPITGVRTIKSPANPSVVVSYKQPPNGICSTTNPNQKHYAGYIHLPPRTLAPVQQNYPINTFFWFSEARDKPEEKPLMIWLNGGPGSSSLLGMMTEMGPCVVVPAGKNAMHTVPREWGWDGLSNLLFIDQPNQVGYSYDKLSNGSLPLLDPNGHYLPDTVAPEIKDQPFVEDIVSSNPSKKEYFNAIWSTVLINGTFSSGSSASTANTTEIAARAAWHFLQAWLTNFPQYNPGTKGINLFAESYGGKYGPTFFSYFESQNDARDKGELDKSETVEVHLHSLGIVNGCIDEELMTPSYPVFAIENPYGIRTITDLAHDDALDAFSAPGGCKDLLHTCRSLQNKYDKNDFGDNDEVNEACAAADQACTAIRAVYAGSGRSWYDIAQPDWDPFPGKYYLEYLNNATVQQAIGAKTNFTESDVFVFQAFEDTGDSARGGELEDIASLLEKGVRVSLIYGDRDYICNYFGGESISLAVNYSSSGAFRNAGYQDIRVNDSYIGGQVRQHGNFSFVRVYQAGHLVPAYQPETSYLIAERLIKGLAIATGDKIDSTSYSTKGGAKTTKTLKPPAQGKPSCFVRDMRTCDKSQWYAIANRSAVVINGVVYGSEKEWEEEWGVQTSDSGGSKAGPGSGDKGGDDEKEDLAGRVEISMWGVLAATVAVGVSVGVL